VIEIRQTAVFARWFNRLRDDRGRAQILARIRRMESGHFADVTSVGDGVLETRIHIGPGYRVYFIRRVDSLTILLSGGDKSTQPSDIRLAKRLAKDY
jgi:putative addiction module killer protein